MPNHVYTRTGEKKTQAKSKNQNSCMENTVHLLMQTKKSPKERDWEIWASKSEISTFQTPISTPNRTNSEGEIESSHHQFVDDAPTAVFDCSDCCRGRAKYSTEPIRNFSHELSESTCSCNCCYTDPGDYDYSDVCMYDGRTRPGIKLAWSTSLGSSDGCVIPVSRLGQRHHALVYHQREYELSSESCSGCMEIERICQETC